MSRFAVMTLVALLLIASPALAEDPSDSAPEAADPAAAAHDAIPAESHAAHAAWTYSGEKGPSKWGLLNDDFVKCGAGTSQSPIDITVPLDEDLPPLELSYSPTPLDFVNNGHTVQVNYAPGSWLKIGGEKYELKQFHFRTPSEHQVASKSFPMAMHLVHKSESGKLAALGVLFEEGDENVTFQKITDHLPRNTGDRYSSTIVTVSPLEFFGSKGRYYRYQGSLTSPPCAEGVTWIVMTKACKVSKGQIAAIHHIVGENNRPVQALNGRTVLIDSTPNDATE